MKKRDAKKHVKLGREVEQNELVEAHAADALRALWDEKATLAKKTGNPEDALVTCEMVKTAIETRLRDVLGANVLVPNVEVSLNAMRTGFDINITPGDVRAHGLRVIH